MKLSEIIGAMRVDYTGIGSTEHKDEKLRSYVLNNIADVRKELEGKIQSPENLVDADVIFLCRYFLDYYTQVFCKPGGRDNILRVGMLTREEQQGIIENLNRILSLLGANPVEIKQYDRNSPCVIIEKK